MRRATVSSTLRATRAAWAGAALLSGTVIAFPVAATAQGRWIFTPSLTLEERYDNNVFGTAHDHQSDFITRITPGVALSYEGETLTLAAAFSATGEIYADDSELNNFGENRNGTFTLGYRPDERLTLRVAANYSRTNDPSSFVATGLAPVAAPLGAPFVPTVELERREASQYSFLAGADYRVDPRWTVRGSYLFALVDEKEGIDSRSHTGSVGTIYDLSRVDQVFVDARAAYFDADDTDTSAALLPGWARQWTPDLRTSLAVGPRVTDGDWAGAVDALVSYSPARNWSATLAYSLGTGLAVGEIGAQNVSALSASVGYQATRDLRLGVAGSWTRTWDLGNDPDEGASNTYGASASVSYRITSWLIATLAYQLSYERPADGDTIQHQQVTLGLTLAYPFRF
jgi:hypothetical protein